MIRRPLSRRGFLQATLAAGAAPYVLPSRLFGQNAPSNRVRSAIVGVGNQGNYLLKRILQHDLAQVVGICDLNRGSYGYNDPKHFYGWEPTQKLISDHYSQQEKSGPAEACRVYTDFREVLDQPDIDAVFVVVPDHWHGIVTVRAAQAGKDIYCEKPLSLTVAEGQEMIHAVRDHNRVLQTGTMERSNPVSKFVVDKVKSGAIGQIQKILTHVGFNNKEGPGPGWQPEPVPEGFDYATWLGPAPASPYHHDRCLYRFRFNYDYSGGQITNFGAHSIDVAQWGLGLDRGGPVEVQCLSAEFLPEGSLFNTATVTTFRARYANGVELVCTSDKESVYVRFEGDKGWIETGYNGTKASDSEILSGLPRKPAFPKMDSAAFHIQNFFECVRTRQDPVAPVEQGHAGATVCHIANVAIRRLPETGSGEIYRWDPQQQRFLDNDAANAMLSRERRTPWANLWG